MADYYTNIAFAFTAEPAQIKKLSEILEKIDDEEDYLNLFDDPDFPFHGAYFEIDRERNQVYVKDEDGQPDLEAIAKIIQAAGIYRVGFQWSNACSKHRFDAFGGGVCFIQDKDTICWETTGSLLDQFYEG